MKNTYLYSAFITAVGIAATQAEAPAENNREKCYGVAKAGENECQGTSADGEKHSCPGWTEKDKDPYGWMYVTRGECEKMGGRLSPPPVMAKKNPLVEGE